DHRQTSIRGKTRSPRQTVTGRRPRRANAARNPLPAPRLLPQPRTLRLSLPEPVSQKARWKRWDELPMHSLLRVFRFRRSRIAIHHLAHQRRLRGELSVHHRFAFEFAEITTPREDVHFNSQLFSWHHRTPESRAVYRDKEEQLVLAVRNLQQQQQTACLRHRFDDQHTRHDRLAGEMTLKVCFV